MASVTFLVLATNAYLPLGVRLVKRFNHFYSGNDEVRFKLFTDEPLDAYLPPGNWTQEHRTHGDWVSATVSKFKEIVASADCGTDYLFMADADTSCNAPFNLDWLLGETTCCEHYGNNSWMRDVKNYERRSRLNAYVPLDTPLPQMYYHAMLFGGRTATLVEIAKKLYAQQKEDLDAGLIACVYDESYVNKHFHYNPPAKVVPTSAFPWAFSEKGGLGDTRDVHLQVDRAKTVLQELRDHPLVDIQNGVVSASG